MTTNHTGAHRSSPAAADLQPFETTPVGCPTPHLTVEGIVVGYRGGPPVLHGLSFSVGRGEILAVLGRNGAGKSTLLRAISGLLPCRTGVIRLGDDNLQGHAPHHVARLGVGHVPEGRRVIPSMTVIDNLKLGGHTAKSRAQLDERLTQAFTMFPALADWRQRVAGTLSGGEQQMLSIARALMGAPTAVLLDEPMTGLAPIFRQQVLHALREMRRANTAVLLVEQNVVASLGVADRAVIIHEGRITLAGSAAEIRDNPTVQDSYLGVPNGTTNRSTTLQQENRA